MLIYSAASSLVADSSAADSSAADSTATDSTATDKAPRIVFLGDSLTAGFGLDLDEAYPTLIQDKIAALGKKVKVVNAGITGDTSAGGLSRLDWMMKERIDILVIALGANDGLRGVPVESMRDNLRAIIRKARKREPKIEIVLAGMLVPPNQGEEYSESYRKVFPEVAREENVTLLPFLLEGVAGKPEMNQIDAIHPTAEGQQVMAENVWGVLEPMVRRLP